MRRALLSIAILAAVGLGASSAFGGKPSGQAGPSQALDLANVHGGGETHTNIEKQSWWLSSGTIDPAHIVINPGGLGTWDINDNNDWVAGGSLAAGATTVGSWQHIFDWNPVYTCRSGVCMNYSFCCTNHYGANVAAPSAELVVTVCFTPQGRCFNVLPVWNASWRAYSYSFCGAPWYHPDDPAIVDIPGSNGGRGIPSTITLTVSNPTARTVKNINGGFGISSDVTFTSGCSASNPTQTHIDYPFTWYEWS